MCFKFIGVGIFVHLCSGIVIRCDIVSGGWEFVVAVLCVWYRNMRSWRTSCDGCNIVIIRDDVYLYVGHCLEIYVIFLTLSMIVIFVICMNIAGAIVGTLVDGVEPSVSEWRSSPDLEAKFNWWHTSLVHFTGILDTSELLCTGLIICLNLCGRQWERSVVWWERCGPSGVVSMLLRN